MVLTNRAKISELTSLFFVPLVFTGIYWLGDFLLDKIARKKQKSITKFDFIQEINKKCMNQKFLFSRTTGNFNRIKISVHEDRIHK